MPEPTGPTAAVEHVVTAADTAAALGSGDVPVLATPRVLAWLEQATVAAAAGVLRPEQTSVGIEVALRHLAPTPVGRRVRARAVLVDREGRRLGFEVTLHDGDTVAASGRVQRAIVDRAAFLARVGQPSS